MSVTFSTFPDSYVRNIPADVPMKAAQGFLATAAISLVVGNALILLFLEALLQQLQH